MATEDDQISVPAFSNLRQTFTLIPAPWDRGCARVETIPQHFLCYYIVKALPVFPRNDQPGCSKRRREQDQTLRPKEWHSGKNCQRENHQEDEIPDSASP